ncbi:unnamed protein product [Caenorhabditis angaria]|uniref:Uncharacterized protein n=1 Tax=Caenorhabditis angaria TaxID=860376 RepID=A0A9P1IYC8_9PELO|nr:unnamed protein product [Caenorhabditis angaria]
MENRRSIRRSDIESGLDSPIHMISNSSWRNRANHGPHPHVEPQETAALAVPTFLPLLEEDPSFNNFKRNFRKSLKTSGFNV